MSKTSKERSNHAMSQAISQERFDMIFSINSVKDINRYSDDDEDDDDYIDLLLAK